MLSCGTVPSSPSPSYGRFDGYPTNLLCTVPPLCALCEADGLLKLLSAFTRLRFHEDICRDRVPFVRSPFGFIENSALALSLPWPWASLSHLKPVKNAVSRKTLHDAGTTPTSAWHWHGNIISVASIGRRQALS